MASGSTRRNVLLLAAVLPLSACVGQAYPGAPAAYPYPYRTYALQSDVLFDFGSARLRPGAQQALSDILGQIRASYPYPAIDVRGYTDSIGSDAANNALSLARAQAVRSWLLGAGIPAGALDVHGYGKNDPVAPNTYPNGADNPAGRQQNRRVELVARPA